MFSCALTLTLATEMRLVEIIGSSALVVGTFCYLQSLTLIASNDFRHRFILVSRFLYARKLLRLHSITLMIDCSNIVSTYIAIVILTESFHCYLVVVAK